MLTAGQVIRYSDQLWRVDYVNACRARIVPLTKRTVRLADGREFDAERAGVNISPNSFVETVTDIEEARTRLELAAVEEEIAEARRELVRRDHEEMTTRRELAAVEAEIAAAKQEQRQRVESRTGGWIWTGAQSFRPGSMGEAVSRYIKDHPGITTAAIVAARPAPGAVAACVSRFHQAGLIKRS